MTMRLTDLPARVTMTTPRSTAATSATTFRATLQDAAAAVLGGVESASSLLPGGAALTAALRGGAASASASAALSGTTPPVGGGVEAPSSQGGEASGSVPSMLQQTADQNMHFLQLQQQMQAENTRYTALSNALKARHETAKNSINNIR